MNSNIQKIKLVGLIEPFNLRIALVFPSTSLIYDIHTFIDETMRKYKIHYKTGRIEHLGVWIPPQYKIGDFLTDNASITIYSVEFGLNLTTLAGEKADQKIPNVGISASNESMLQLLNQDINEKFIKKKIHRSLKKEKSENNDDKEEKEDDNVKYKNIEIKSEKSNKEFKNKEKEKLHKKSKPESDSDQESESESNDHEDKKKKKK